ncbi:MAG: asparagine synthetase B, partial [Anaerolineae bacterium]|nr:asparagine synthetase B [Anaerolineae bacterium]
MCGIVVAYGKDWKYSHQALDLIGHRGPDGQAIEYLQNGYLAHTRLSIVDVAGGRQPMADAAASHWLVCNGEIYNHPELRERYTDYPYRTSSDSEDILAVYAQHKSGTPRQLEGMYAFAVVDGDELFLARDPLGIKPLYYGCEGETFYFASEIKALQDVVTNVKEFPPGYSYSSKHGFVQNYDLQTVVQNITQDAGAMPAPDALREQLRRSVNSHLMSDVPLGVFLSGGLDSSIIAALVKQEIPDLHSFSVGVEGSDDLAFAWQVARYLG